MTKLSLVSYLLNHETEIPKKTSQKKKWRFSNYFDCYYTLLFNYALKKVGSYEVAEDIVQETFIELWENSDDAYDTQDSIKDCLFVTLKNRIIDFQRKTQTTYKNPNLYTLNADLQTGIDDGWELAEQIDAIYKTFSAKTVEIFQLSRKKGCSYSEIATQKEISIKMVELHISTALIAFSKYLKNFL